MIRTVIIDDELHNITNLQVLTKTYCPALEIVGSASDATEAKPLLEALQPDLLFLDIQMPGKNGFELLQSLSTRNFEIIFVTAYDYYGIQAIKFAALDYLLKPIQIEELQAAVNKVQLKAQSQLQNPQLEKLIRLLQAPSSKDYNRLALPTAKEIRFVEIETIIRCESVNSYTTFYFTSGEKMVVSKPLYEYDKLLTGHGFIRCHQSHLVNRKYIRSWVKEDGGYLLLHDSTVVPVSKQRSGYLRALLITPDPIF